MWSFGRSKQTDSKKTDDSSVIGESAGLFESDETLKDTQDFSASDSVISKEDNSLGKRILFASLFVVVSLYLLGVYWSIEPDLFDVRAEAQSLLDTESLLKTESLQNKNEPLKIGFTTLATTERLISELMDKPGGFLTNDRLPPSIFLDNIPAWEFGVVVQIRDMVSVLRNDMSRSQSQSLENSFLQKAEPLLNISTESWVLPTAEGSYLDAKEKLGQFRIELNKNDNPNVQFYARADNLRSWLELVNKRLGGLSQRLSAAVGQERINTDLSGDSAATQSTKTSSAFSVKTPWFLIDDVFYESRGACWALIHLLKAVQIDFADVLEKKNANASLAQIIRELEATQETVWSPMILNGSGFGIMANHSLVMANYISRANAGLIDLRELLARG
ncbi:MAG: hypothetical protein COB38_01470 [Gammaproteobacteria bacterium]|nr:MAG: hypothetical protein COB38_01470 [Gammaproteobacteria bacterium]